MALEQKKIENDSQEKSICLVQLTRFGDIIQTYQAATTLKKRGPTVKIVLVARRRFAQPLLFLLNDIFDQVYFLEARELFKDGYELSKVKANVSSWIGDLNKWNFDILINLSWSKSSSYLCSLVRSRHKLGMFRNTENEICVEDSWSQLVYSTVMRGPHCPFSIVDIYKSIMGVFNISYSPAVRYNPNEHNIVMHLFASIEKKYWRGDKWVEVIYKILKTHGDYKIILVGSPNEEESADKILSSPLLDKYRGRVISKVGQTSMEDLYGILLESSLFVGHDSSVSHLASLTDIPIITLSLGTVRPRETAPYSENAYIVAPRTSCFPCFPDDKCGFYQCHADVPYQVIFEVVSSHIKNGKIDKTYLNDVTTNFLTRKVSIFKTKMSDSKFIYLEEIISHTPNIFEIVNIFYRISFLYILGGMEEEHDYPELSYQSSSELEGVILGLQQLYELSEFGKKYALYILEEVSSDTPNLNTIKRYSDKIGEIDELQDILSKTYPALKPMIEYFRVQNLNLQGENIVDLTKSGYLCHSNASTFCSVIYELSQKTLISMEEKRLCKGGVERI